jgi:hypothetical protein
MRPQFPDISLTSHFFCQGLEQLKVPAGIDNHVCLPRLELLQINGRPRLAGKPTPNLCQTLISDLHTFRNGVRYK